VLHHLFGAVFGYDWGSFNFLNYAQIMPPIARRWWPHRGCVEA
jgi:hypothetical protein